jgi:hypothetical protein
LQYEVGVSEDSEMYSLFAEISSSFSYIEAAYCDVILQRWATCEHKSRDFLKK